MVTSPIVRLPETASLKQKVFVFSPMELQRSQEFCVRNLGASSKLQQNILPASLSIRVQHTCSRSGDHDQYLEQILLAPATQEIAVRN